MVKVILFVVAAMSCFASFRAQVNSVTSDKDWAQRTVFIKNSIEAEYIVRIGDVDNLGFGWQEDFDPFCGFTTLAHTYPWKADPNEMPGFDRILLSSKFKGTYRPCNSDGYSDAWKPGINKPVPYTIPTLELKEAKIENASLQLFIDDFQAPLFCSKFQITMNGKRFVEAEKILNLIEQTGPVGKLISIPIPEEFYPDLVSGNDLNITIDEIKGVPDGFALDFMRLVINRMRADACIGSVAGTVVDKVTNEPIASATVGIPGIGNVQTDASGNFRFDKVPAGYVVLSASALGYVDGGKGSDVNPNEMIGDIIIPLARGQKKVNYAGTDLRAGESITLNKILFDQGKAELKSESIAELEKILAFMKINPTAEIELSGHTSSEGDPSLNRSLSYKRVNACKTYLTTKGIDTGRILVKGCGPDKPVAPNDTEVNRAKNRRVEMRILSL